MGCTCTPLDLELKNENCEYCQEKEYNKNLAKVIKKNGIVDAFAKYREFYQNQTK